MWFCQGGCCLHGVCPVLLHGAMVRSSGCHCLDCSGSLLIFFYGTHQIDASHILQIYIASFLFRRCFDRMAADYPGLGQGEGQPMGSLCAGIGKLVACPWWKAYSLQKPQPTTLPWHRFLFTFFFLKQKSSVKVLGMKGTSVSEREESWSLPTKDPATWMPVVWDIGPHANKISFCGGLRF